MADEGTTEKQRMVEPVASRRWWYPVVALYQLGPITPGSVADSWSPSSVQQS